MAEVTNHMVIERISHILNNQPKASLFQLTEVLFIEESGYKTAH